MNFFGGGQQAQQGPDPVFAARTGKWSQKRPRRYYSLVMRFRYGGSQTQSINQYCCCFLHQKWKCTQTYLIKSLLRVSKSAPPVNTRRVKSVWVKCLARIVALPSIWKANNGLVQFYRRPTRHSCNNNRVWKP